MTETLQAGILGATGNTGAETLRYLTQHPNIEPTWATSRRHTNVPIERIHPHLTELNDLRFSDPNDPPPLDVLFCATPHGTTSKQAQTLTQHAEIIIDLSSDFRLNDPTHYQATYNTPHPAPDLLPKAAYGLPEVQREPIETADWIAAPGCIATASQLALLPLARESLIDEGPLVIDAKIGSTAGGASGGRWSTHATRSNTVRPYAPTGHRHEAEIQQNLFPDEERDLWMSAHAVDMPRGILVTAHLPLKEDVDERALRRAALATYQDEPFVHVTPGQARPGGVPEPRFVVGTNHAQVALMRRKEGGGVALCAIDNLGKGAAGSAVQSMNVRLGWSEGLGLEGQAGFP